MGCASSSPVISGEGVQSATGSMADKAKAATNNAIESGEQVLNDAGEAITETVESVEESVSDAVTNMKDGVDNALSSGMAFMKNTSNSINEKVEEIGEDMKSAGNDLMKHVPLKDAVDNSVQDLMKEKMKEVDQMADDLMEDTQDAMNDVGERMGKAMAMVGLPKVSSSSNDVDGVGQDSMGEGNDMMMMGDDAGKISSKTPIQSMDSFKTGSPEPELQKLEEMTPRMDSPKPSNNMLELVDLEATPTHPPTTMDMKMAEIATSHTPTTTTSMTIDTIQHLVPPSIILPNGISTPADTLLLGEVIQEDISSTATLLDGNNIDTTFHIPPPSPRHDGIVLTQPTQWEQFADSIVKTHLDKALRRGGGAISATATAVSTTSASAGKEDDSHATEQNIEL